MVPTSLITHTYTPNRSKVLAAKWRARLFINLIVTAKQPALRMTCVCACARARGVSAISVCRIRKQRNMHQRQSLNKYYAMGWWVGSEAVHAVEQCRGFGFCRDLHEALMQFTPFGKWRGGKPTQQIGVSRGGPVVGRCRCRCCRTSAVEVVSALACAVRFVYA